MPTQILDVRVCKPGVGVQRLNQESSTSSIT
jgi:hypothetical protein